MSLKLVTLDKLTQFFNNINNLYALKDDVPTKTSELTNDSGYQTNAVDTVTVNGTSVVTNKAAAITVPTKVSDLTIDASVVVDSNYTHTDENFTAALKAEVSDYSTKKSTFATKAELEQAVGTAVGSVMHYRGSVADEDALPTSDNATGDFYNIADTGKNVAWNGTDWDDVSKIFDPTGLATTDDLDDYLLASDLVEVTNAEVDAIFTAAGLNVATGV